MTVQPGLGVQDLAVGVGGLGFRVWGLGLGLRFYARVWVLGFEV